MYKAYKYRIYPNKQQLELMQKTFGCVRFVYNQCLEYKINKYENENVFIKRFDLINYVNRVLKYEYEWLKEVEACALENAAKDLDDAYKKFFKEHSGFPKFKSKKNNYKSYRTARDVLVDFNNNKIRLPKLGFVKAKISKRFDGKIKYATVSQVPSGKYFVSITFETEHKPMESTGACVGIDLGIKELITTSDGEKFVNPKPMDRYAKKISRECKRLSKKQAGSKNYEKQRIKVAKLYEKIHNIRLDNLHKVSYKLINENQVIVSEDLSINEMLQNHRLAKSISDCAWYELTRQLEYKAKWNNRDYIKINRFFPSSQTCSNCGFVNSKVKDLSVREWVCPKCYISNDRDTNAAINILNEGLKLLSK